MLSRALPSSDYRLIVVADPRYRALDEIPGGISIPCSQFAHALEKGRPLYDVQTLMRYVEEDLALIDAVQPDLIVGDFRLSLAVSARLRRFLTLGQHLAPYKIPEQVEIASALVRPARGKLGTNTGSNNGRNRNESGTGTAHPHTGTSAGRGAGQPQAG